MSAKSVEATPADTAGAGSVRRSGPAKSSLWARFDHAVVPYILISPFFLLFIAFGIFPIVYSAIIAFQTFRVETVTLRDGTHAVQNTERYVGFGNFTKTLSATGPGSFWHALVNTFGIFLLSTVPQLLMALVLASLLNRRLRAQSFFRVGILLPYVTPVVASSLVFVQFFSEESGQANWLLSMLGVEHDRSGQTIDGINWRNTWWSSWLAIAIMVNWKWVGYNALLYLAAMQSIPKDVYEAAALDGASPWQQLWRITVPMIRPMVIFTVVLSTIGGLQIFAEPVLLDTNPSTGFGGSVGRAQWQTVAQLIWKTGWKDNDFGHAGAMSWVLFFVVVAVAGLNALLSNRIGGRK